MTTLSLNIRNVCALVLVMVLLLPNGVESGNMSQYQQGTLFVESPVPYNEQWGRLVYAFAACLDHDYEEGRKEIASAPRYGKMYAGACQDLFSTLRGEYMDKEDVVKQCINSVYYRIQLALNETFLLRKQGSDREYGARLKLRRVEEKAMQEGLANLVIAETAEDKRRMVDLEQEYKKGRFERERRSFEMDQRHAKEHFEWEQEKEKRKFEEELKKQQEAEESKK